MTDAGTGLNGVEVIVGLTHVDDRGGFTRVAGLDRLRALGMRFKRAQLSYASNLRAGTIRGMHFQVEPHAETKLIWCVGGAVFDVLLDVRPTSPTYGRWSAFRLDSDHAISLLVPPGVAHGYQCLTDDATLCYLIDGTYHPESARTVKWSDPTIAIDWPLPVTVISEQDESGSVWPIEF